MNAIRELKQEEMSQVEGGFSLLWYAAGLAVMGAGVYALGSYYLSQRNSNGIQNLFNNLFSTRSSNSSSSRSGSYSYIVTAEGGVFSREF